VTFRSKLFWIFTLALTLSVALIAVGVSEVSYRAFHQLNAQYTDAFVGQFRQEFARSGQDVVNRVKAIAEEQATVRMAVELSLPKGDASIYVNDARGVSESHQLDFMDFVNSDGTIISSVEWPARYGYKMDWVAQPEDWVSLGSFLMKVDTQDGPQLGLMAVSRVPVADKAVYVIGGQRMGKDFLASLVLPSGMRSLLYMNLDSNFQPGDLIDASGPADHSDRFASIIAEERQTPAPRTATISWSADAASDESFHALPLLGRQQELLGVLLVGSSQHDVVTLQRRILWFALGVVAAGLLLGLLMSWWGAARVTRPVQELARGAREVSQGNWGAHVQVRGRNEIAQLALAFNQMTQQLTEQRERLVQTERVAAWRELARRLAHELKNPLFPLQTTVENLERAREQSPDQFDEVFRESTGILLAEIENLKKIVGRFSDFARMPQPELGPVNLNDVVRGVVKLFEAQFGAVGRPPITQELHLEEGLPIIQADAVLLHKAIENLVLNAMDAMPAGGVLMLHTEKEAGGVSLEISDTGGGLTKEECDRLFTPYYTTKQHGTGLGLAIVQSVVSDHGGRISVESETGVGTSFHIHLPQWVPGRSTDEVIPVSQGSQRPAAEVLEVPGVEPAVKPSVEAPIDLPSEQHIIPPVESAVEIPTAPEASHDGTPVPIEEPAAKIEES
jgi:two-component system, NtrC family, nitrogen regulation sensor histidine kinase NtrY